MIDFDKRPLFYDQGSSDTESESEKEKRIVSNKNNLNHIAELHSKHSQHRNNQKKTGEQPKYTKMPPMKAKGKY